MFLHAHTRVFEQRTGKEANSKKTRRHDTASPSKFRLRSIPRECDNWIFTLCSRPLEQLSSPPTICLKEIPSSRDASDLEGPQNEHLRKSVVIDDEVSASSARQKSGTKLPPTLASGMKASMAAQQVWRSALCWDWCLQKAVEGCVSR